MGKRNAVAILLLVAFSFVLMAIEVRYLHREAVAEKPVAWVGLIACVVAVVGALLALSGSKGPRVVGVALLWAVATCGLAGFYFHTELKPDRVTRMFVVKPEAASGDQDRDQDEDRPQTAANQSKQEDDPPPFAPLALTGLSLIAILTVPPTSRRA